MKKLRVDVKEQQVVVGYVMGVIRVSETSIIARVSGHTVEFVGNERKETLNAIIDVEIDVRHDIHLDILKDLVIDNHIATYSGMIVVFPNDERRGYEGTILDYDYRYMLVLMEEYDTFMTNSSSVDNANKWRADIASLVKLWSVQFPIV